ncbi:adenosine deaminase family protein [Eremomyces bilateralis CBS 781.70]|uniref:adenosine deaminase n=1 Tax=Eremomyces bilateralis CBS 781.70 TaxID=1392243 RepID=A0A6G1FRL7_9PEZI|nr:adenosine deaminase family protein [Eremomyces bilateralis CBS 781.70]KAF1808331.1 adenosine deaminase family protein [Eremomyces bilateralis CBS 781.70]
MPEPVDEKEWAESIGFPQLHDPFIQKYYQSRDALIEQENKQRSDHWFRENLSPAAREACAIVDQIRFEEQQTLWTRDYEDSLGQGEGDIYPGMMFMLAKERMEKQSKLWSIVKKMPKGTLLHCHLQAMVDVEWLVREALETGCLFFSSPGKLSTAKERVKGPLNFVFQPGETDLSSDKSIWTAEYTPNSVVPASAAADSFPEGGRDGFVAWLVDRGTVTPQESLLHHHGLNEIWRKFTSTFLVLGNLAFYEPIYRKFLQKFWAELVEDGVQYVDMRSTFVSPFLCEGKNEPEKGYSELFRITQEELDKFKSSDVGKDFWGARFIWTTIRSFDKYAVVDSMKECIEIKKQYPELLAGYDLVGQEDPGRTLDDLTPELFWFRKSCAEQGLDVPFFFHAGETNSSGGATDHNLFDAIALGTRRIGHGFSLFKHPLLIDLVKNKKILIETCPISNEILRLTASILQHPLPALLAQGVPASLCNDDPAILGQGASGMTHDFWQALQGWENLGLAGLGSLAENSVRWAAFDDCDAKEWQKQLREGAMGTGVRAERLKEWMVKWERFCQWIVDEYGVDENTDPAE